ncbi:MAG: SAM-dependent methyltransferase [Sandarakinorhabdus sp.]|nr:SAM-dependent methyltransferase [Sandarakinorhabdus sp.]
MRLDTWMQACNAAYYAGRDPFGTAGDFITAPEISQMFGEIIGGWVGDLWLRAGSPRARLVELGPGRGTLMADALRVAGRLPGFAENVALALVETSPVLRTAQASRLAADWFDRLEDVPGDLPLILIANGFFDALPVRQFLGQGLERAVAVAGDGFFAATLPADGPAGESCEAGAAIAASIGDRLRAMGGAALIIDYGYADAVAGDSVQALRNRIAADPFAAPGTADLTAHVDFTALARSAGAVRVSGPVPQGVWLSRLGIEARAAALKARATPAQAATIEAALVRLTAPMQMGVLFKAMAFSAPAWPAPAGFDE